MSKLGALMQPQRVAVVGANEDPTSFGGRFWRYLGTHSQLQAMAVNGRPNAFARGGCFSSLADLPAAPDVVVLATPSGAVESLLEEASQVGARAAIVVARISGDSRPRIQRLASERGLILLGASSLGLIDANREVVLSSSVSLDLPLRGGPLALVAQSGALMGVLHARAMTQGMGLGLCVSTGDQLQIRVEDVLVEITERTDLSTVGVYLEDLDLEHFTSVARCFESTGRQLIVLKGGLTRRGGAVATAHSGALAADGRAFKALARDLGVIVAAEPEHLLSCMQASLTKGRRWYVATLSGGLAAVAADLAAEAGVELVDSGLALANVLRSTDDAAAVNPVDIDAFAPTKEEGSLAISSLARDPAADGVLVVLNDKPGLEGLLLELGGLDDACKQRIQVCSECSAQYEPALRTWVAKGGNFTRGVATLLSALGSTRDAAQGRRASMDLGELLPAVMAQAILAERGIPALPLYEVAGTSDLDRAMNICGMPLVLKVANVEHRSGTNVAIAHDAMEAASAFRLLVRTGPVVAQPFAGPGLEFYIGITKDPVLGPLFLIGPGGPVLESIDDVSVHLGLPNRATIRRCLRETAVGRWLYESTGNRFVDLEALVDIGESVCRLVCSPSARLLAIDLNPVLVGTFGATVVDAKLRIEAASLAAEEMAS